jgi:hypothetical protein
MDTLTAVIIIFEILITFALYISSIFIRSIVPTLLLGALTVAFAILAERYPVSFTEVGACIFGSSFILSLFIQPYKKGKRPGAPGLFP